MKFMQSIIVKKERPCFFRGLQLQNTAGFTLIELLVVIGIVGIFMAAVFSLYQTHHRSAYTQEETAEVQQNLRVAMDQIMDDTRMAGFLVPGATNPIAFVAANNGGGILGTDILNLNIASGAIRMARNTSPLQDFSVSPIAPLGLVDLAVDSVATLLVGDGVVIYGSQDRNLVIPDVFNVITVNNVGGPACAGTATPAAAPCVTIQATAGGIGVIKPGDMVLVTGGLPYPGNINYQLVTTALNPACPVGQTCLERNAFDGTGPQIIANNITGLQFMYVLMNGTEVADPTLFMNQVRGIRATLTGQRVNTVAFTGGVAQPKNLVSVAGIRNVREP